MNAPGCPINPTLEALGDRWSLIGDLMFGNRRHFRELPVGGADGVGIAGALNY